MILVSIGNRVINYQHEKLEFSVARLHDDNKCYIYQYLGL